MCVVCVGWALVGVVMVGGGYRGGRVGGDGGGRLRGGVIFVALPYSSSSNVS